MGVGVGVGGGAEWCRSHDGVSVTAELCSFPSKAVDDDALQGAVEAAKLKHNVSACMHAVSWKRWMGE